MPESVRALVNVLGDKPEIAVIALAVLASFRGSSGVRLFAGTAVTPVNINFHKYFSLASF